MKGPRIELLQEAMREDDVPSSNYWAAEVLNVDSQNFDAHYTLAVAALDSRPPNLLEARRHLEVLTKKNGIADPRAAGAGDARRRRRLMSRVARPRWPRLARSRSKATRKPVDRLAGLRIASMRIRFEDDPARLNEQVSAMLEQVKEMGSGGGLGRASCRPTSLSARANSEIVDGEIGNGDGNERRRGSIDWSTRSKPRSSRSSRSHSLRARRPIFKPISRTPIT